VQDPTRSDESSGEDVLSFSTPPEKTLSQEERVVHMRRKLIAGNWKMNLGPAATSVFFNDLRSWWNDAEDARKAQAEGRIEVLICPSFVSLDAARRGVEGLPVLLGAQNCYFEPSGAFTGEVALPMLAEAGCRYVIVGHSERRQIFGEDDETAGKKVRAVLETNLLPILCVGETLEERENDRTFVTVERQLLKALAGLAPDAVGEKVVLAYEPVWAIGTGRTAKDEDAQDVCRYLRRLVAKRFGDEAAGSLRVLYGGSVKADNAAGLMARPDIDGALVGGASLKAASFGGIILGAI
jgi:triosephosphate isomerase